MHTHAIGFVFIQIFFYIFQRNRNQMILFLKENPTNCQTMGPDFTSFARTISRDSLCSARTADKIRNTEKINTQTK